MWTIILNIMAVVGFIATILSLVVGIMTLIKQKLMYYSSSINLIEKNKTTPKELKLFYYEDEVPRLTRTTFTLFKKGNKTILGEKILEEDPLRLEFATDAKILDYSILKTTREANKFEIKKTADNVLKINFKFLDSNDGICLTVLHTGDNTVPKVEGTIMGLPNGLRDVTNRRISYSTVISSFFNFALIVILLLGTFFFPKNVFGLTNTFIMGIVIGFVITTLEMILDYKFNDKAINHRTPKKLRSDDLNF